jgi:hypothetical protein
VKYEAVWLDHALPSFEALPIECRDQVAALIDAVCEDRSIGVPDLMEDNPALLGRMLIATAGPAVVFYQVIDDAEIVRIMRVYWRG